MNYFYYLLKNDFVLKISKDLSLEEVPILIEAYLASRVSIASTELEERSVLSESEFYEQFYGYDY